MHQIFKTGLSLTVMLTLGLSCTACSSDSPSETSPTGTNTTTPPPSIVTEVVEMTSAATGKVWMDRNMGASVACTQSVSDFANTADYIVSQKACFGDYYQWGRATDGHEKSDSTTTTEQAINVLNVGHAKFIRGDVQYEDWAISADTDGVIRNANWNPCPTGFRIPTQDELVAEKAGISNGNEAFVKLGLPMAGLRGSGGSLPNAQGISGQIWSSEVSLFDHGAISFGFYSTASTVDGAYRAYGYSVRCIKQ